MKKWLIWQAEMKRGTWGRKTSGVRFLILLNSEGIIKFYRDASIKCSDRKSIKKKKNDEEIIKKEQIR